MARNTVKIHSGQLLDTITLGHTTTGLVSSTLQKYDGLGNITTAYQSSIKSSATSETKSVTTEFSFPSQILNAYSTAVLSMLQFRIFHKLEVYDPTSSLNPTITPSGGLGATLCYNGMQESIDANGNLSGTSIIESMNAYKVANGAFPTNISIRVTTRVDRPPSVTDSDGSVKDTSTTITFVIADMISTCDIDGGMIILRPSMDISTGHSLPSGFSGVYQLLSEEIADDDTTRIGCEAIGNETAGSVTSEYTSVVGFVGGLSNKKILQIRPIFRYSAYSSNHVGGIASSILNLSITVDEAVYDIKHEIDTTNGAANSGDTYQTTIYDTEDEYVILPNSELITAINNYWNMPQINMSINTYTRGPYEESGYKTTSGAASMWVTQVYLEVIYENPLGMNIYHHEGSVWKQVQTAYQKQNGTWVEITEDECKSILSNAVVVMKN